MASPPSTTRAIEAFSGVQLRNHHTLPGPWHGFACIASDEVRLWDKRHGLAHPEEGPLLAR